jgi:hypothetical protein
MPSLWKAAMAILVVCLLASMAIAAYRLATTPTEILGDGFRGVRPEATRGVNDGAPPRR